MAPTKQHKAKTQMEMKASKQAHSVVKLAIAFMVVRALQFAIKVSGRLQVLKKVAVVTIMEVIKCCWFDECP